MWPFSKKGREIVDPRMIIRFTKEDLSFLLCVLIARRKGLRKQNKDYTNEMTAQRIEELEESIQSQSNGRW